MKWCQPHWDQLRTAIADKGMDKLGAQDSKQAFNDMVDSLEGKETDFDPLMGCFWAINNQMMSNVGLRAMGACPLCILVKDGRPDLVENWVQGCTNHALEEARRLGLLPPAQ